jgi:type II secretory pathway pseudopilin PulG
MQRPSRTRRREFGFSLLEMMLAAVILLVGLVAVAQLVPASILLNYRNRTDSSALVFAQREMDQFLDQPLSSPAFTDAQGYFCQLGNAATTNVVVGSPLVNNQALIDFNQALVPNYSYATPFIDPNDPSGTGYDVRWAVIVTGNGTAVSSKRFILGIRQQGGSGYFQPVTLDMMVGK